MTPELSRPVALDRIGAEPVVVAVVATPAECAALARRFDWRSVADVRADVTLVARAGGYRARGRVTGSVVQACAVTDDDVASTIAEPFDVRLVSATPPAPLAEGEEVELRDDDLEVVEFDSSDIDAGEIVAQTLALAVPAFARSPRAAEFLAEQGVGEGFSEGPLAALLRGAKKG